MAFLILQDLSEHSEGDLILFFFRLGYDLGVKLDGWCGDAAETYAVEVSAVVKGMKMKELRSVGILDVFDLGEEGKALTLHIEFRNPEKTLDAAFIKEAEDKVITVLDKAGFPLRS